MRGRPELLAARSADTDGWKEEPGAQRTPPVFPPEWWRIFNDAELNSLETQAVEANQDLKRAVARVTEARALARVSEAELYPSISAGGGYSRDRLSDNRGKHSAADARIGRLQRLIRSELRIGHLGTSAALS